VKATKEAVANPPTETAKVRTNVVGNNSLQSQARKRGRNRLASPPKERKKSTDTGTGASTDSNHNHTNGVTSPTRASRDGEGVVKKTRKAPSNNTTIRNFFMPRNKATSTSKAAAPTSPDRTTKLKGPTAPVTPTNERLERKIKELEQQCADKDQQLKAVADNRTILHTALQTALAQKTKEFEEFRNARQVWEGESRKALEKLVRDKATQETKEIRERLAADGARLGRITYSRVGMRVVESWEEGFASMHLHARRHDLKERKSLLLERLDKANKIAEMIAARENKVDENDAFDSAEDWKEEDWTVGGIVVRNRMDAMEAMESVRFHLQTVHLEEKKVIAEEAALNEEKGAHVRALKRIASEDASRFKSRPKLHDRYLLKQLLGKGGFSEVWRAFDLIELREVAVKIHQLDPRWSDSKKENYTKHVSREYEIHRNVRHPRIVSLYDVFEIDNNSFATVLECCDGTDLDTLLKNRRQLPEKDARAILLQILSGMRYLSQPSKDGSRQGIIHYDLKPGNILFDEYGDAKITDFGLSKIVDAADTSGGMELTSQGAGTYWYLPPECFMTDDNVRISNKVDVWSIGVIFYQMIFGRRPFGDGQTQDAILNDGTVLNAHAVAFPEKITVTDGCKQFIQKCLTYDQTFRPTISQLCQEPYLLEEL
jgi:tousled-like kinase